MTSFLRSLFFPFRCAIFSNSETIGQDTRAKSDANGSALRRSLDFYLNLSTADTKVYRLNLSDDSKSKKQTVKGWSTSAQKKSCAKTVDRLYCSFVLFFSLNGSS